MSQLVRQVRDTFFELPFLKRPWQEATEEQQSFRSSTTYSPFSSSLPWIPKQLDREASTDIGSTRLPAIHPQAAFVNWDIFATLHVPSSDLPAYHLALQQLQRASRQRATADLGFYAAVYRIKQLLSQSDYAVFTFTLMTQIDPLLTRERIAKKLGSCSNLHTTPSCSSRRCAEDGTCCRRIWCS